MYRILDVFKVFTKGIGLKLVISFFPPCGLAWVFFFLYLREIYQKDQSAFWTSLTLGLGTIAIGSGLVIWLILALVPPLRRIIENTVLLEQGNLDCEIPYRTRKDEIGQLGRILEVELLFSHGMSQGRRRGMGKSWMPTTDDKKKSVATIGVAQGVQNNIVRNHQLS